MLLSSALLPKQLAYVSRGCSLSALVPSPRYCGESVSARTTPSPPLYVCARIMGIKLVQAEVIDSFYLD